MYYIIPLFVIFILNLLIIWRYIKLNGEATTISGVLTSLNLYLCAIPIVVFFWGDEYMMKYSYNCLTYGFDAYFSCYMSMIIFISFLFGSYELGLKFSRYEYINTQKLYLVAKKLSYFTLFIGGISFLIYANLFGGIETLLLKAEYLRSFATNKAELVEGNSYILVIPARLVTVAPYLLLLCRPIMRNKKYNSMLFLISIVCSLFFYLANAGKTDIFFFILSFSVPILLCRISHKWIVVICLSIISLKIVEYLDAFFVYLGTGEFMLKIENGNLSYLNQFVYPIRNVLNLDNIVSEHGFRFFQDFATGVLNIIPGVNFEPSYSPTSEFFGGSNWKLRGGVPNDAITFGYLECGYLGVAVEAIIIGIICARVDKCIRTMKDTFSHKVLKCTLIILFFIMFTNADVVAIIRNQFTLTILTFIVLWSKSVDYRK